MADNGMLDVRLGRDVDKAALLARPLRFSWLFLPRFSKEVCGGALVCHVVPDLFIPLFLFLSYFKLAFPQPWCHHHHYLLFNVLSWPSYEPTKFIIVQATVLCNSSHPII